MKRRTRPHAHVRAVLEGLGLTQTQLGQLLGVHFMTVSRWCNGHREPNAYQMALLDECLTAASRSPHVGRDIATQLSSAGAPRALYTMLAAALREYEYE